MKGQYSRITWESWPPESNLLGIPLMLRFANKINEGPIQQNHLGIGAARIKLMRDPFDFEIR